MMKRASAMIGLGLLLLTAEAAQAADPSGTWRMSNGKVTVRISACGDKLCGWIVGLKKPLDRHGRPKTDKDNPNPALRNRPLIGLTLLNEMRPAGRNRWQGRIYNPDDGRTYSAKMKLSGSTMQVKGCVLVFCKSQKFVRIN
jgi:uncharacterized protein (DUF2147 family)